MSEQATTPPCIIVVFGARGDLTKRLVMPALYNLRRAGALGEQFAIVGMDHGDISERAWRSNMGQSMTQLLSSRDAEFQAGEFDTAPWDWLRERMHYLCGDFTDLGAYQALGGLLDKLHKRYGTQGNVLFYLATAARFFEPVLLNLGEAGLVKQRENDGWRRVIVEKNPSATICPAPSTSMPLSPKCCTKIRCSASIISWARKPCRTFLRSASPTACSSRCGIATASTMCRSLRPKPSAWKGAGVSTTPPAACATWCRTICSSCWQ